MRRPTEGARRFGTWTKESRDGFLIGVAFVYGAGFALWQVHAWRAHLGILPLVRIQYLLAGLWPTLVVLGGALLGYLIIKVLPASAGRFSGETARYAFLGAVLAFLPPWPWRL